MQTFNTYSELAASFNCVDRPPVGLLGCFQKDNTLSDSLLDLLAVIGLDDAVLFFLKNQKESIIYLFGWNNSSFLSWQKGAEKPPCPKNPIGSEVQALRGSN